MIHQNFVYLGFVLSVFGGLIYLVDVAKGRTQPNRVTFVMWSMAGFMAFVAQLSEGVGIEAGLTFIVGIIPFSILLVSLTNPGAYWKLRTTDYFFGALALIALIVWQVSGEGLVAIISAILIDFLAAVPTIMKAYRFPASESAAGYGMPAAGALLVLISASSWTAEEHSFAFYLLAVDSLLFTLVQFKLGARAKRA